ncbi:MAG: PAS domain S-box protein [Lacunisphaera sp.]|nr:PAS domain S-box protein [Lacunisphaera sp.]
MNFAPRLRPLALLAALTAAIAGLWAMTVWGLGEWQLLSLGADYIPMALPTAILFAVLGLALAAQLQWPVSRAPQRAGTAGALLTLGVAGLAGLQASFDLALPWDHWLLLQPTTVGEIPVGRMAPLTALAFGFTAYALLVRSHRFTGGASLRRSASVAAIAGGAIGTVVAIGYAAGTPLLYGGQTVPMALLTALAFMAVNGAQLLAGPVEQFLLAWRAHDSAPHVPVEHRDFSRRLSFTMAGLGLLIALGGFFYLRNEHASARQVVHAQLEAIVNLKAEQITDWRTERMNEARFLQRTTAVVRDVAALLAAPDDPAARTHVRDWLEPIKGGDRYQALYVFDPQARLVLAIPDAAAPAAHVHAELLAAVLAGPEPVFADLQRHSGSPTAHLDLLVAIRTAPTLPPIAIIMLQLDPQHFLQPLIQTWPVPSATAESLLVRREGDAVVFLSELRHQSGEALTHRRSVHEPKLVTAMALRGKAGVHAGVDYRGVPVLAVSRPIPGSPWFLIAKIDLAEVYTPIRREALQIAIMVGLLLLAVVLTGLSLWRQRYADTLHRALAAEQEHQATTERLGLVMRHANDSILLMDIEGRILEASECALATYGYTLAEFRALPPGGLRPPATADNLPAQIDALASDAGTVFETRHRRKDGSVFPVEVSGRRVMIGGRPHLLGIYRDITERSRLAEELVWQEAQFRAVFNHAPVGMSLTSGGKLRLVNAEHARITGVPVEQSAEPGIFGRVSHPEDYARQSKLAEKFINGEIDHYTVEKRYLHPGGRVQWAELTSRFFPGPITGDKWIVTTVTDIAERKAHEQEIDRLNRIYFVISQVNQTIVRMTSQAGLFADICRVLVEFGGFKIAWIGWLDEAAQLITPVAIAGDEHGYVPGIKISVDPAAPESHGPSGTAFREGRNCVCNDFFGDPALRPWHDRARPCGFHSSIALPLRLAGQVRGLLTVYAAEQDFFGPQEITLLEEAAGDLSFALDVLAGHDRSQAAETALQRSRQDFSRAFLSSPTAVCINTLADARFLDVNDAWIRLAGYRREEVIGRTTLELPVWAEEQERAEVRRLVTAGIPVSGREARFRRKDGVLFDTLFSVEPIGFGGEPCLISTIIDITGQKQAQQKLTEQITELRRWHEATLGREERILDLKREVNELLARAGAPARYPSAQPGQEAGDA